MKHFSKNSWNLVWVLARTDFKLRYQGSVLGFFWALLKPLFLFAVLFVVFSHFFGQQTPFYGYQLLLGIIFWNFFSEGTLLGLTSLQSKSHLLKNISFPRWVAVVAATLQSFLSFLIQWLLFFVFLLFSGLSFSLWQFCFLGIYILLLYALVLGFSFFAAPFFLRFRDFNQIWEVLLMVGFYAAPIIYPLSMMPPWLQPWLYSNPVTFLIEHARGVLFLGSVSRWDHHAIYFSAVGLVFLVGGWFFRKFEKRVVELL